MNTNTKQQLKDILYNQELKIIGEIPYDNGFLNKRSTEEKVEILSEIKTDLQDRYDEEKIQVNHEDDYLWDLHKEIIRISNAIDIIMHPNWSI